MSNQKAKNRARPWQEGSDEKASFGSWLRRQREVREIGLREIADASKISLRYLEALEQDRFDVLPAPVFSRGFLREYAKYVGLDADEVVNHFLSAYQEVEAEQAPEEPRAPRTSGNQWLYNLLLFAAVAAVLVLVALIAFRADRRDSEELAQVVARPAETPAVASPAPAEAARPQPTETASTAAAPPEPVPPPAAEPLAPTEGAPPPVAPLVVNLDFAENCWVEARIDGRRYNQQEYAHGESLLLTAQESVELTLGNAPAVRILVNGKPFPVPPSGGKVLRGLKIDLAALSAPGG
ncbi:MAG TPA: RodZ domain-containing protein [Thermoanaerobaculia bacterium]|nr:RodZ domain-containing protein [Thermoanaerobaculia bacterium]